MQAIISPSITWHHTHNFSNKCFVGLDMMLLQLLDVPKKKEKKHSSSENQRVQTNVPISAVELPPLECGTSSRALVQER
jgi:hypothetical protein